MRVLVAMSGGVDSAVAAARLIDDGHQVEGVHLRLVPRSGAGEVADAARIAGALGIPLTVEDFSERFRASVITDFLDEYAVGRTPNPCVRCNEWIKFGALRELARDRGFDVLSTGHYARVIRSTPDTAVELHRCPDPEKDQSYVLSGLSVTQLSSIWLPLGSSTKAEVRAEALTRGIPVADKKDSLDICFVPGRNVRGWLAEQLGDNAGVILGEDGAVLGKHDGSYGYTVGQRRGLNLTEPSPDGQRRYVLRTRPDTGTVVVGPRSALVANVIVGQRARWCAPVPPVGADLGIQIRAHGEEIPAVLTHLGEDGTVRVRLGRSLVGVAPGQILAFYRGSQVLGSATISSYDR
jgi:tRNA-specific 2-thiouridylase